MKESESDLDSIREEPKAGISVKQWRVPSATGVGDLAVKAWIPADAPKLILQLIHGMAEYIDRYDEFARVMAAQSVLVVGFDLPGHGQSTPDERHLGFFAEKDGWKKVLDDIRSVCQEAQAMAPGLPLVLFGHSMGSFFARKFAVENGPSLAGLILSGTAGDNSMLPLARFLASRSVRRNGPYFRDASIDRLMHQGYLQKIEKPVSANAWLSRDPSVVKAYDKDPLCGYWFTSAGYRDLFDLLASISGKRWASQVREDLPILLLSGEDDPVGGYGAGIRQVQELLKKTGHKDVSMILYQGGRHEMLNEVNKEAVYQDIASTIEIWMKKGGPT